MDVAGNENWLGGSVFQSDKACENSVTLESLGSVFKTGAIWFGKAFNIPW